jgi:hypothetical protein
MLTIQPKFTHLSNSRPIAFRSEGSVDNEVDEGSLKTKADFYERKVREFDETLGDTKAPKTLKTMAKVFKVVSEALFEGWLVAWGATKGSNVVKSAILSGMNGKTASRAKNLVKPVGKYFNKAVTFVGEKFAKIQNSEKVLKFVDKANSIIDRLDKNTVGHYVVQGAKIIGKGVKAVFDFVSGLVKKAKNPVKDMSAGQIYDKVTKVTSTTLGVGAGVAGAYNSATNAEARKAAEQNKNVNTEEFDSDEAKVADEIDDEGFDYEDKSVA